MSNMLIDGVLLKKGLQMRLVEQVMIVLLFAALMPAGTLPTGVLGPPEADAQSGDSAASPEVTPPPDSFFEKVRDRDRDVAREFYKKYIDVEGMPTTLSARCSPTVTTS